MHRFIAAIGLFALGASLIIAAMLGHTQVQPAQAEQPQAMLDPAAWGHDHVGQGVPEYVTGDECLFCHREEIGTTWSENYHARTIRPIDRQLDAMTALQRSEQLASLVEEVQLAMGRSKRTRFLKRLPAYGQLALLSAQWEQPTHDRPGRLADAVSPHWQDKTFGQSCAGCHCTGVDSKTKAFSTLSLDCYTCHGDASLDHTTDSSIIHLAKTRHDSPRVVISICAQCHVRTGKSRSTGRPYPNNFVAGDNLFRDFQVDFSDDHLGKLNPADRHILQNVRDVVTRGDERLTCLSCHNVHRQSSGKHRRVAQGQICLNCHYADRPKSQRKVYEVHSRVCGY